MSVLTGERLAVQAETGLPVVAFFLRRSFGEPSIHRRLRGGRYDVGAGGAGVAVGDMLPSATDVWAMYGWEWLAYLLERGFFLAQAGMPFHAAALRLDDRWESPVCMSFSTEKKADLPDLLEQAVQVVRAQPLQGGLLKQEYLLLSAEPSRRMLAELLADPKVAGIGFVRPPLTAGEDADFRAIAMARVFHFAAIPVGAAFLRWFRHPEVREHFRRCWGFPEEVAA